MAMASEIYLIRHCQATGQAPEAPLTEAGRAQALRLRDHLAALPIARVVSSPFLRARDSAAPLATRLGLTVAIDARLSERVLGADPAADWRNRLRLSFADPGLSWPGGESGRDATARGRAAVDAATEGVEGAVAIVTHGNLLALILQSFDGRSGFDAWAKLTNPDIFRIDRGGTAQRRWHQKG